MDPLIAVIQGILMLIPIFNMIFGAIVWGLPGFFWGLVFTILAAAEK